MNASTLRRPSFVPWDMEVARLNFGANCGPVSFAALVETEVCRVISHFPHFEHSNWTNLTQMIRAVEGAGYFAEVRRRELPSRGLALIQWLGPWTEKDFFSRWSLPFTHWIAVDGPWVFDHSAQIWQSLSDWSALVAKEFVSEVPRAFGWAVKYGLEVRNKSETVLLAPARGVSARPVRA